MSSYDYGIRYKLKAFVSKMSGVLMKYFFLFHFFNIPKSVKDFCHQPWNNDRHSFDYRRSFNSFFMPTTWWKRQLPRFLHLSVCNKKCQRRNVRNAWMRILVVGSQSSQTTNRNVNYSSKEIKYNRKVTLRDSTIIERKKIWWSLWEALGDSGKENSL